MSQIPALISDLAVILISAGLVTLLFKKLKQPVVLGVYRSRNTRRTFHRANTDSYRCGKVSVSGLI